MAVIGQIRKHSFLLVFLIGASIFGFLIMDATNSQFSILKGRKDTVGRVNGEKITYNDFTKKMDENIKSAETQMRGAAITDDQRNQIRSQTWNELVNDIIFNKIYEKLGINVTGDEMNELAMGENASQYIKQDQQFRNPQTGQFDPSQVRLYLSRLDQDPEGVEPGTVRRQWLRFETNLKQNEFQQKYNNLISKGFYVPNWMAEMAYNDQSRSVDFRYLELPYNEVNDNDVKISDDDLRKYLDDHADQYKQDDETRKLDYVGFDIVASSLDSTKIMNDLIAKKGDFAKGKTTSDDSAFVKIYSDIPFDEVYYEKAKITSPAADSFFAEPVKSVVGPYVDGEYYKLAKICDRKMISDSVHVREIKISFEGITTQEAANVKFRLMDSIYRQIDSLNGNFQIFAFAYSDDQVSKMRGGDIGWVKQGMKDKYYNNLIFYRAQKGKVYKVPSQSENAIYLVQVVEDRPTKQAVQVAYFASKIVPSTETENNIRAKASNFATGNQTEAKFVSAGKMVGAKAVEALRKDDYTIPDLGPSRDLVKWAFNARKGDVSAVYTLNNKDVVAMVEQIRPKGLPELDAVREQIKVQVIKKKKYELLADKIKNAGANSIDALAAKLGKTAAQADHATFANPNIGNGLYESKVVATALSTGTGKMSGAIEGNAGAFVAQTVALQDAPKAPDYSMYAYPLRNQLARKAGRSQDVEKKLAKIEDNRFDFF